MVSPILATNLKSVERFAVSSNKCEECGKIRRFLHPLLNDSYNLKHSKFDLAIYNTPSPDADFESVGKKCKCNGNDQIAHVHCQRFLQEGTYKTRILLIVYLVRYFFFGVTSCPVFLSHLSNLTRPPLTPEEKLLAVSY
jgi:hypothetical protein